MTSTNTMLVSAVFPGPLRVSAKASTSALPWHKTLSIQCQYVRLWLSRIVPRPGLQHRQRTSGAKAAVRAMREPHSPTLLWSIDVSLEVAASFQVLAERDQIHVARAEFLGDQIHVTRVELLGDQIHGCRTSQRPSGAKAAVPGTGT